MGAVAALRIRVGAKALGSRLTHCRHCRAAGMRDWPTGLLCKHALVPQVVCCGTWHDCRAAERPTLAVRLPRGGLVPAAASTERCDTADIGLLAVLLWNLARLPLMRGC